MFKKMSMVATLSVLSASAWAANDSAIKHNTGFLNTQLQTLVNATGVTPLQHWFQHIHVSGLLNLDAFGQTNDRYLDPATQYTLNGISEGSQSAFNVSTLAINLDAQINPWIGGHIGLFYATRSQPAGISGHGVAEENVLPPTRYYPGSYNETLHYRVDMDTAYVDVMNLNKAPVDIRIGKQYFAYGQYDRYAMMPTLTQQMTELRGTGVELNYLGLSGLHVAVFAYRGGRRFKLRAAGNIATDSDMLNDFGGSAGYSYVFQHGVANISGGYLYNIHSVGTFQQNIIEDSTGENHSPPPSGEWNINLSLAIDALRFGGQYAAAITPLKTYGWDTQYVNSNTANSSFSRYAKPSAGNLYIDYRFKTGGDDSKVVLSHQWSNEANAYLYQPYRNPVSIQRNNIFFALPESREALEYDVNVRQSTMLGFEVNYDSAYGQSNNGSGDHSLTGIARISVLL